MGLPQVARAAVFWSVSVQMDRELLGRAGMSQAGLGTFGSKVTCVQTQGIGKQSQDLHNTCKHSRNNDSSRGDELSQRIPFSIQLLSPAWLKSNPSYGMNMSGQE